MDNKLVVDLACWWATDDEEGEPCWRVDCPYCGVDEVLIMMDALEDIQEPTE